MYSILTEDAIMQSFAIHQPVTFGVVWQDFGIPFSLPCPTAEIAVNTAKTINHRRALINEVPHEARARPVALGNDETIHWLDGEGTCDTGNADGSEVL